MIQYLADILIGTMFWLDNFIDSRRVRSYPPRDSA